MARIADHPLRLHRLHLKLSQQELANRANVQRSAISAIEDGRTQQPTDRLISTIASILDVPKETLIEEIQSWLNKPLKPSLSKAAQNLMVIPPYVLGQYYSTFSSWRAEIAPTHNPAIIRDYENGKLLRMPDGLSGKLLEAFGIDGEYLVALEGLKRG
jgi:transcriptional regulator with XRE-family HTH domain